MTRLRSCTECSRHVFVTETRCPFCQAALERVSSAPIYNIKAGMSRAQRFTLVAAAVAGQALIGCAEQAQPLYGAPIPPTAGTGGTAQGSGGVLGLGSGGMGRGGVGGAVQAPYGAPIDPNTGGRASVGMGSGGVGGASGAGGSGGNGPTTVPPYGAPIDPLDAGALDAGDAMKNDGGGIQPLYGGAVPLYGAIPPNESE